MLEAYLNGILCSPWSLWHRWFGFLRYLGGVLITGFIVIPWLISSSFFSIRPSWLSWGVSSTFLSLLFFSFLLFLQLHYIKISNLTSARILFKQIAVVGAWGVGVKTLPTNLWSLWIHFVKLVATVYNFHFCVDKTLKDRSLFYMYSIIVQRCICSYTLPILYAQMLFKNYLTIRLRAWVVYEQIVNEAQPSWLLLVENKGE